MTYSFERAGGADAPEVGEDLILQYSTDGKAASDGTKVWIELDRQLGGGPPMQNYLKKQVTLPNDALKSNFQFRFRSIGSAGTALDNWFVDDVSVSRTEGSIELLAAIANELGVPVTTSSGAPGTFSLLFGTGGRVEITPDSALNGATSGDFSIEMWVRPDSFILPSTRPLISTLHDDGNSKRGYGLLLSPTNQLQFYTGNGSTGTSSAWDIQNGPTIANEVWTHIAATFDATSGPVSGAFTGIKSLYINGVLVPGSVTQLFEPNVAGDLRIADSIVGDFYKGRIDEVRVWNVPLSAVTIESQYNTTVSATSANLQGYWRFDEGSGTTALDLSTDSPARKTDFSSVLILRRRSLRNRSFNIPSMQASSRHSPMLMHPVVRLRV